MARKPKKYCAICGERIVGSKYHYITEYTHNDCILHPPADVVLYGDYSQVGDLPLRTPPWRINIYYRIAALFMKGLVGMPHSPMELFTITYKQSSNLVAFHGIFYLFRCKETAQLWVDAINSRDPRYHFRKVNFLDVVINVPFWIFEKKVTGVCTGVRYLPYTEETLNALVAAGHIEDDQVEPIRDWFTEVIRHVQGYAGTGKFDDFQRYVHKEISWLGHLPDFVTV